MPRVFLSPSQQTYNQTVLGVNEAQLMSLITDAIEPLLQTNEIQYTRIPMGATPDQAIAMANAGNYDVYLGIHSNASPIPGAAHGNRNYFWEFSVNGRRLAQEIADEFSRVYYDPSRAIIVPDRTREELRRTRMPAVIVETAFHDNEKDARWIQTNIQAIAEAIVRALTRYFGQTYVAPCMRGTTPAATHNFTGPTFATVCTQQGSLNIRSAPNGNVMFTLPRGTNLLVTGPSQDNFTPVRFNFWDGWAATQFICICNTQPPISQPTPIPPAPPIAPPILPTPPIVPPPAQTRPTMPTPIPPQSPATARLASVQTEGSNLNLRTEPSMSGQVIVQMPNGSRVLILGQQGDWFNIFWNGQLGWASKEWIRQD